MFRWIAEKLGLVNQARVSIPDCYPDWNFADLCKIFNDHKLAEIAQSQKVCIMPLVRDDAQRDEAALGLSLSQILIRNLMLVPGLSVRGFEDVPLVNYESVVNPEDFSFSDTKMVIGYLEATDKIELNLIVQDLHSRRPLYISGNDLDTLILDATQAICQALELKVDQHLHGVWSHGLPPDLDAMVIHGALRPLSANGSDDAHIIATKLVERTPQFVLPLHYLNRLSPETPALLLRALNRDPYDPQLCYHLFRALWTNNGPNREAFQFLRRALEICPAHGKAHMFAAHAAAANVDMREYSQLGYTLLPDSPNAVSHYLSYLVQVESITTEAIPLVIENIDRDPFNPGAYWQAIEIFSTLKQYSIAIDTSQKLLRLLQPPLNPHTLKFLGYTPANNDARHLFQFKQRVQLRLTLLKQLRQQQSTPGLSGSESP